MTRAEIEIMLAEAIDDFDEPVDNSSGVPRARSMGTSLPIPDSTLSASLLHHSLRSQRSSHIGSSLYVNSQCDDSLQRVATRLENSRLTGSLPVEYTKRRKSHLDQPHDLIVSPTAYPTDKPADARSVPAVPHSVMDAPAAPHASVLTMLNMDAPEMAPEGRHRRQRIVATGCSSNNRPMLHVQSQEPAPMEHAPKSSHEDADQLALRCHITSWGGQQQSQPVRPQQYLV
jgi:hypothetical protein